MKNIILATLQHSGTSAIRPILEQVAMEAEYSILPPNKDEHFLQIYPSVGKPFFYFTHQGPKPFVGCISDPNFLCVHLSRDPRDVLVSWVKDDMFLHNVAEKHMGGMLLAYLNAEFASHIADAVAWTTLAPTVLTLTFDQLKADVMGVCNSVCTQAGINVDAKRLGHIVEKFSFEAITGRQRGEAGHLVRDVVGMWREGKSGGWARYFDRDIASKYNATVGAAAQLLGYEACGHAVVNGTVADVNKENIERRESKSMPTRVDTSDLSIVERVSSNGMLQWLEQLNMWRELEQRYDASLWASEASNLPETERRICRWMALTTTAVTGSDAAAAQQLHIRLVRIADALARNGTGTFEGLATIHGDELVQIASSILVAASNGLSEVGSLTRDICRRDDGLGSLMGFMCGCVLMQTAICIETNDLANLNERISNNLLAYLGQRTFLQYVQLARIRQAAEAGCGSIAFFCPDAAFRTHFGNLPTLFQEQNHSVLFLYGTLIGGEFEEHSTSFYVGGDMIRKIDSVDLFFTGTIMDALPDRGKRALVHHGSFAPSLLARLERYDPTPPDGSTPEEEYRMAFDARTSFPAFYRLYDYFLVAAQPFMNQICDMALDYGMQECNSAGVREVPSRHWHFDAYDRHFSDRRLANRVCVIPAGYPQIDNLAASVSAYRGPVDTITYAPTPLNGKPRWEPYASVRLAGPEIIAALLSAFPDYRIVFKPYILDHNQWTQAILDQFEGVNNFVVDWSGSKYGDLYARTAVLVSDFSSTAYTYAFATLRPVIFSSGAEQQLPEYVRTEDYCVARSKVGEVVTDPEGLINAVRAALKDPSGYRDRIADVRDDYVYHVGESEAYIANAAKQMIAGEKGVDWRCFDKPQSSP
ncbi:MAG: sulfotransferase domain-containing protein [Hydrogenophilales bacterium]|nr:sulfotransferase domain-containing protein [Hydrogenophilales bacterium]